MGNLATIANNFIRELQRIKIKLNFGAPIYFAIGDEYDVKSSNLWFILENTYMAAVILPYEYIVLTCDSSSAFTFFINENGVCNDSIEINGWRLQFDTPKEGLYRTYSRYATISKGSHCVSLSTNGTISPEDFKRIWEFFISITKIDDDYALLPLLEEIFRNKITIERLTRENIRIEYERYICQTQLKANEELLKTITELIKTKA